MDELTRLKERVVMLKDMISIAESDARHALSTKDYEWYDFVLREKAMLLKGLGKIQARMGVLEQEIKLTI